MHHIQATLYPRFHPGRSSQHYVAERRETSHPGKLFAHLGVQGKPLILI